MAEPTQILEYRLNRVEEAVSSIAESLKTLTRLEEHHKETREAINRAFEEIRTNRRDYEDSCDRVEGRLRAVELQLPILRMTSRWVIGGTLAVVSAVFATCGSILWMFFRVFVFKGG